MKQGDEYYTKPSLWCLFCHQSEWIDQVEYGIEGVMNCTYCQVYFDYPTSKSVFPVYKK